jgi:hypothetical protein
MRSVMTCCKTPIVFLNEGDEPSVFDMSDVIEEKTAA